MAKVENTDPNEVAQEVVGASSQVAKLLSVKNYNLEELFGIDKDGDLLMVGDLDLTGALGLTGDLDITGALSISGAIEAAMSPDMVSYIIWKSGSTYYAKNGATGAVAYSGSVAATVINSALGAINSAGGGHLHIRAGTYPLAGYIRPYANTRITGEGKSTVLQAGYSGILVYPLYTTNVVIENVAIDCNGPTYNSQGIYIRASSHITVRSCYFSNVTASTSASGIICYRASSEATLGDIRIIDCDFEDMLGYCVYANSASDEKGDGILVEGCILRRCGGATSYSPIRVSYFDDVHIDNNIIVNTDATTDVADPITIIDGRNISVRGNSLVDPGNRLYGGGIYVWRVQSCTISGNTIVFTENPVYEFNGVVVATASDTGESAHISIFGNTVDGGGFANVGCGIYTHGQSATYRNVIDVTITGNVIVDTITGMEITYTTSGSITGNYIRLNTGEVTDGVYLGNSLDIVFVANSVEAAVGINTSAGDGAIIMANDFSDSTTPITISASTNYVIRYNRGYVTENSGTSTGTGAEQTIAHGLSTTPTQVILTNYNMAGCPPYESSAADATNIYVTGVLDKTYRWRALAE